MGGKWKGDANPGGPGGRTTRIPAKGKGQHTKGGGKPPKKGGCGLAIAILGGSVVSVGGGIVWGVVEVLS